MAQPKRTTSQFFLLNRHGQTKKPLSISRQDRIQCYGVLEESNRIYAIKCLAVKS